MIQFLVCDIAGEMGHSEALRQFAYWVRLRKLFVNLLYLRFYICYESVGGTLHL